MVTTRSQSKILMDSNHQNTKQSINPTPKQNKNNIKLDINFDEASAAWRENKKHIGNGVFKYICSYNTRCKRLCNIGSLFCNEHLKYSKANYKV